jgi:phage terminase small subunit
MGEVTIIPPRKGGKSPGNPPKITSRQEKFCQNIVAGMKHIDAYLAAGFIDTYKGRSSELPGKLLKAPRIIQRIAQLRALQAMRLNITINTILLDLERARQIAEQDINPMAMIAATMAKAKLLGFLEGPGEAQGRIPKPLAHPSEVKELTLEEWEERFKPKVPPTLQ